jgi:Golgi phosphoprotein 3
MSNRELFLYEELMLLALKDREGTTVGGTMYSFAVGGAVLAELLMSGRIRLERKGKKSLVEVVDGRPVGDPLLDEWLAEISEREKPRTPQDWVQRMANTKDLKHRVAAQLSRKGILRTQEDRVLGIFTRKVYPELDPGPERDTTRRIESAILQTGGAVAARTAVLIALAHHAGLLKVVLDKPRLKKHKDPIQNIVEGDVVAEATKDAIEAMQAAMAAAGLIPVMVATTVSTS